MRAPLCLLSARERSGLTTKRYPKALKTVAGISIVPAGIGVPSVSEQVTHGEVLVEGLVLGQVTDCRQHVGTRVVWAESKCPHLSRTRTDEACSQLQESAPARSIGSDECSHTASRKTE